MSRIYFRTILILFTFVFVMGCKKDDDEQAAVDPTAENKKGLGTSAEDIMQSGTYNRLTVEMAYSAISEPSETAKTNFRNFVEARVNKPGGVSFVERTIQDQPGAPFSIQEIRNIEDNVRTIYTEGDNIAVFVFFSSGRSENDTETTVTLGTAYRNTSMVIYESTLQLLAGSDPDLLPILESTVLNHEFGHILGLTNILSDDIHANHEDPVAEKHCIVDNCLMYFDATNIGRSELQRFMQQAKVPELDPLCIADLQAKGGN
ncbi:membrane metalloprotease [Aureisphaera galaxeae]|uniref:membrane metalloprotease n=1 Tax=Aureisphaera galaxeae TaxID=1538023 RepID=UPI00234FDFF8|nr:membrane metalloprotease [Aureisphaera galaxeae]MDC8004474.1 membrane metalloprotease [Aureisphaera galaxeae]